MHRNPVKRGPVLEPQQWQWSSYCSYAYQETGEDQSVAQGGDEGSGCNVVRISRHRQPAPPLFTQTAKGGPPAKIMVHTFSPFWLVAPPFPRFLREGGYFDFPPLFHR
jgi:hypothetical protein